jgi:hypothetical protein
MLIIDDSHYLGAQIPPFPEVRLMTRKNSRYNNDRNRMNYRQYVGSITIINELLDNNEHYAYSIITKKDKIRNKALRLIREWNGINVNNIDEYLKQINTLHIVTTKILSNIEYTKDKNSMLPYLQGKFSNINSIIEAYNDYLESNPFVAVKYSPLESVDLTGVVLI